LTRLESRSHLAQDENANDLRQGIYPAKCRSWVNWGSVYLVAFSRACTHKGTVIDALVNGIMNCSNHGQDFDAATGKPTGTANKTSAGLTQYPLEVRADGTVWAV
jgi:Rieske Fe-S protein